MPKPACPKCQRFYRPAKNGIRVLEAMPHHNDALPGNLAPESWAPYKIWHADLWQCPGCGHQLISGWGNHPESERHYPEFHHYLPNIDFTINDC